MTETGELTYTRVHRASPELLFDCMTQPDHLTRFWGPTGATTPIDNIVVDPRPGGAFETTMVGADGGTYTMRAVYVEVERPHRLVWVESEAEGGMLTTITFNDLYDGRTEVVTHQTNVPEARLSAQARAGFSTSLDRFDDYLAGISRLRSADGTVIAFERMGSGPALILVDGAMCYRGAGPMQPLASILRDSFTVYAYDRRGRGGSTDTLPYTVQREIEDLQALVAHAGGSAYVYGISSGAAMSIAAAAQRSGITKLALYEPPFLAEAGEGMRFKEYGERLNEALDAGNRGDAVAHFMTLVGMPAQAIEAARAQPGWANLEAIAPTLAYDERILGAAGIPRETAAQVHIPALLLAGGNSPQWLQDVARATAEALPHGSFGVLDGQTHDVAPDALAHVLTEFFSSGGRAQ